MEFKKQYRYRIYTENGYLAISTIQTMVLWYFLGCTIIETHGMYKGVRENGLIVEIITERVQHDKIEKVCKEINRIHNQECCLVTCEEVHAVFV